jgi:hypothetical protein
MKATQFLLALTIVLVILSCKSKPGVNTGAESTSPLQGNENQVTETYSFHKYGIKSGIVTYEIEGMGMKMKLVLYFDDFGNKEAEEKYEDEQVKSISICDGKEMYNIIPSQKTAYSNGICSRGIAYRFAWDEISKEDQNTKAKMLSNMTVAGKDCESYSYDMGTTIAVYAGWQNINLYLKTSSQNVEVIQKAIKIEENVEIPSSRFQVPSDYEIQEAGAF